MSTEKERWAIMIGGTALGILGWLILDWIGALQFLIDKANR